MAIIRLSLGKLILFFNWAFPPNGIKRDPKLQAQIDVQTASLTLYQCRARPFRVKVRRAMKRQSLSIQTRDVKRSDSARDELLTGGGNLKVPCLRVEDSQRQVEWIYESADIIRYLEDTFVAPSTIAAA
jgi:glutaredoxin